MSSGGGHDLHQPRRADRRAHFRVPGALLAGNRHGIALRYVFAADVALKQVFIGQREALFEMIPQLTGDSGLHAEIPPVAVKRIARQGRLFLAGAAGDQVRPFAARGVIQPPVHQLAHPRHLCALKQRGIAFRGFIYSQRIIFI